MDLQQVMKEFMARAEKQLAHAASPVLYFSVGLDHMEPREELIEVVNYIRTHQDKYELIYGTAEDYMREVARHVLPTYEGEFRGTMEKKCVNDALNGMDSCLWSWKLKPTGRSALCRKKRICLTR